MTAAGTFWARRRAAVRAEAEADLRHAEIDRAHAVAAERETRADAEVLAEMGLPDPASMTAGDDFAAFLSREVPEHLRRKALRTLWRSNPVLACVDGLNDYDDDYLNAAHLNQPAKTAYQVGKGMLKHVEEMARQARVAAEAETDCAACEAQDNAIAPAVTAHGPVENDARLDADDSVAVETTGIAAASEPQDATDGSTASPRRMRFRFEEATA